MKILQYSIGIGNALWFYCISLLLFSDLSIQQQQFFYRPSDHQWYFYVPGQQPQPLQQQQIQLGLPLTTASQQQQPQQQTQFQQQPQFQFQQPQQQQQQQQFFFPQQTQSQFQPQFEQQQPQQIFQQQQQAFPQQQQTFPQQQHPQQPQQLPNWFVPSFGPGEFQEQLPELIRPPVVQHVQQPQPQPPQQQLLTPPPPPPQFWHQPQQPQQFFSQQQQPAQPPVIAPRIVHIQPQEFQEILPKLLQGPKLAEQVTPKPTRPPTTTTRAPVPTTMRRTKRPTMTTTRAPPPPPTTIVTKPFPVPQPAIIKEQKEPLEFDLPPPPPSRFLPESEKIRIAEFVRQQQRLRNHQQGEANPGPITDTNLPTLLANSVSPPSTTKAPRRSTLGRLAAAQDEFESDNEDFGAAIGRTAKDPNKVFLECCKRKRVAKQCESRCNFDVLNKKILTGMFLGSDKCPTEHGLDLFTCAAQDSDHSTCCRAHRVHKTSAGDKCLAFCNLAPEAPKIQLDVTYLPCWAVLNEVKNCFRDNIVQSG